MKFKFNLQLFAKPDVTATVTAGGYMNDTEAHEYYDRTLEEAIYEELTLDKYCDVITLPKNNGKTMVFRKLSKYIIDEDNTALVEGQVPEEDDPMKIYEYRVNLSDHGGYITYSDQLDIYSLNDGWATRLQRNQGRAVGELFENKIKNIMYSSTNRWFAGATDLTSIANARAGLTGFQLDDLRHIRATLLRNKVKPFNNGEFEFVVDPEVEADILTLEKQNQKFSFVELANFHQKDSQLYSGNPLGSFMGFHFVSNSSLGQITTSSVTGKVVHGSLILGKYNGEAGTKIVKLEGYGKPQTIIKPLGSAGTNDPLNQKGSIAWKCMGWGGTVLYPEAVMVYESLAGEPATVYNEQEREHFIGGSDGKGNGLNNYATPDYVNGGVVGRYTLTFNNQGKGTAPEAVKVTSIPQYLPHLADTSTHKFDGWYNETGCTTAVTVGTELTADKTIYAKWTAKSSS